jgi:hypothetical protein
LIEELLADIKAQTYTKRKYSAIQDKVQKAQSFERVKKKENGPSTRRSRDRERTDA